MREVNEITNSGDAAVSRRIHPGYLARNLDVAAARGLNAEISRAFDRMRNRKDCPLWLIESLSECLSKSNRMIGVAVKYRDELPRHIDA